MMPARRWPAAIGALATLALAGAASGAPAPDPFPWKKLGVCAPAVAKTLKVSGSVSKDAFRYAVAARSSRALGFSVSSFTAKGVRIADGGTNVLGSDSYRGRLPRLRTIEKRWVVTTAARFPARKRICRTGAELVVRIGKRPELWQCVAKGGVRRSAALGCRVARLR